MSASSPRRRRLAPEVIQTSMMDCGPASLKCLLEGFGIPVSYGRLREACQTDVDGTSIDVLEETAVQLGLNAEQIMVPKDHALLPEAQALPAIVVVTHPNGVTHFIVVWRRHGRLVQVMDPAIGRRWISVDRLLSDLYLHQMPVPAEAWREYASGSDFIRPLRRRLDMLGIGGGKQRRWIKEASEDPGWRLFGRLDAATRMTSALVNSGGISTGRQATRLIERLRKPGPAGEDEPIPSHYWTVLPLDVEADEELVLLRGAVMVRVLGHSPKAALLAEGEEAPPPLSPELVAALEEKQTRPGLELLRFMRKDGLLTPLILFLALLVAAGSLVLEALLFRGLLDIGGSLGLAGQRFGAVGLLLLFLLGLLLLELPIAFNILGLGRHLETRLRMAFMAKIPKLDDRYFASRLTSDMAERSHAVSAIRGVTQLVQSFLASGFGLLLTTGGLIWLDPACAPLALVAAVASVVLPLATNASLSERDLRVRSHNAALSRFYLDGMLGLIPIRTHGAERALRREHEGLLTEWVNAGLRLQRAVVTVEGIQAVLGLILAVWLLVGHISRGGVTGSALLFVYWALNLPALGAALAKSTWQYPAQRNVTLRLLEPLGAPEAERGTAVQRPAKQQGVAIEMRQLSVIAAGQAILDGLDLEIPPGSQVGIVGPSGAGKSSFVGLLLGWHRPAGGTLLIDGQPLNADIQESLRRQSAWVDPSVQLWNRSLLANLKYGNDRSNTPLRDVVESAELKSVLEKLPRGLQTGLGESGSLVSGGEGQRVRLGRAMMREDVRLVILDEPFRGLDRDKRRRLITRTRERWKGATLLCITHDVSQTTAFDRVLVIDGGRVVEDDSPSNLLKRDSRYHQLMQAEEQVRHGMWSGENWRRWWLSDGTIDEGPRKSDSEEAAHG